MICIGIYKFGIDRIFPYLCIVMIKCYYIFKTYYGEFGLYPIGYKSYYEWVIFGCTFKTKIKNITY